MRRRDARRPVDRLHARSATRLDAVTAKCDALDGATDGLIQDTKACQAAFDLNRDVPTCTGARDGTCLSAQKTGIGKRFSGATTSTGTKIYRARRQDAGIGSGNPAFQLRRIDFTILMLVASNPHVTHARCRSRSMSRRRA